MLRYFPLLFLLFMLPLVPRPSLADDVLSISGSLNLSGVEPLSSGSVREDPDIAGKFKLNANGAVWRFHSWFEGGWDGAVSRPARDRSLFKNYDEVYQSNTPFLECKELFVTRSSGALDLRAGIQRIAWGRLDEYPPNDLLNPWDYTQFLRKSLEDRKIGVPAVSATVTRGDWTSDAVWVPVFVPYRLPLPDERWAGSSPASLIIQTGANVQIDPLEPDLPDRTLENGSVGLRVRHYGEVEWSLNLFHGYDPRPVFKTDSLVITPRAGQLVIDPGYVPDFHRITSLGIDAAAVSGDLSIRAEAAYSFNRFFDIRRDLWGYPATLAPGTYPLNPIEERHDSLDYGVGADYRLFEDGLLTIQAQQTVIFGNVDLLYERRAETIVWANVKAGFMNELIETNATLAYNPEHGGHMTKANAWYAFSDSWKAGIAYLAFTGPTESFFGRFSRNDQVEGDVVYSW